MGRFDLHKYDAYPLGPLPLRGNAALAESLSECASMIYRALYHSKAGRVRYMTFAHAGGIKAAHTFAQSWELRDDKLQGVVTVREIARPSLQFNLSGV
jgi:hypothetical protein